MGAPAAGSLVRERIGTRAKHPPATVSAIREHEDQMQIFGDAIRFGIHSGQQNTTFEEYLQLWQRAEELGFEWASVFDHFMPIQTDPTGPCFDGMTLLSAMAAHTSRIRCGILVVGNSYRNPALLAKIATTIDHVSGGRLEFGVGAGWYELEHQQYNIPFPPIGRRIRMLSESARILKSLWTETRTDFAGRYYTLNEAMSEPKPVQEPAIPLWIGGAGEKLTLRVVAESADGWNTFFGPLDYYEHKLEALAGHCRDTGRDPADIRKSLSLQAVVGETEGEVTERLAELSAGGAVDAGALKKRGVVGTPEQCVEQLLPYLKAGVRDFIIGARVPADMRSLELIATKVSPMLKAEAKALV